MGRASAPALADAGGGYNVKVVICETLAAIALHIRELEEAEKPNYSGTSTEKKTLCGATVGWDTKHRETDATCRACIRLNRIEKG